MLMLFTMLALLIFAYVCGSLSSAIIVSRIFGLPDPRTDGSGNPGATNVLRLGDKKLAILVLFGDVIKGIVPIFIARFFLSTHLIGWIGLAAILGHIFPVFFQFKGGKGVATALGVLLALSLPVGLSVLATWIFIAAVSRYSSLAAIIATLVAPVYTILLANRFYFWPVVVISLLVLWRHQDNIKRLIAGTEMKIGSKKV